MKLEVCCGSYEDAIQASKAGAERIELNQALELGGLTPSPAMLNMVKQDTDLEVVCMVRPRGAGFVYRDSEYKQMKAELVDLLKQGADGIAFGFLTADHRIDRERTREFVEIIQSHHASAVFHRAIDCTEDFFESLAVLHALGIDRVLTSGQESTAVLGRARIQKAKELYGAEMEILPGAGVNAKNVRDFAFCGQAHSSAKDFLEDPTTISKNGQVSYAIYPESRRYQVVTEKKVSELLHEMDQ